MSKKPRETAIPPEMKPAVVNAMLNVAIAKTLQDALARGYVVQFSPAGDPLAWRNLAEFAWAIICNAGQGDWTKESDGWREAAEQYREQYHAALNAFTLQPPAAAQEKTT